MRHSDIARLAGVSRTTVSYVLNSREDVTISQATRRRVLGAADKLSYRRNELARSLASGRTQTIGVLTPQLDMTFHAGLINGIQQACLEKGYRILLGYSNSDVEIEQSQLKLLLQHQVDAIILIAAYQTCAYLNDWLEQTIGNDGTPCLVLDHVPANQRFDYVISDDRGGALSAVNHLISQGHRRIAHISGGRRSSPTVDRMEGYRTAMEVAGIPVDASLIAGDAFHAESGTAVMEKFLDMPHPPTAVFAANDYLAAGAMKVLEARQIRVPQDIAVVGFGDAGFASFLNLTTVRRTPTEMGKAATSRLLQRLHDPHLSPTGTVIPTKLVVRHTS